MSVTKAKGKELSRRRSGVIRAKSDFFRSARYGLTLQEHRIIYYAILKGQQDKKPFEAVTISIPEFQELCDLKGKKYYGELRKLSKELTGRVVEVAYKENGEMKLLQAPWLTACIYNATKGTVTIKPNKELQPFFEGKPFSETEFYFLIRFTSQYAERLYELIKSFDHKKIADFYVDDLRQKLSITGGKYPNYADLKRFALNPAIKDINTFTDLEISVSEKRGRHNKVEKVYFSVKKRKIPKLADRVAAGDLRKPLSEPEQELLMQALLDGAEPITLEKAELPGQLSLTDLEDKA